MTGSNVIATFCRKLISTYKAGFICYNFTPIYNKIAMTQGMHELIQNIAELHGQLYLVNENIKSLYQSPFQRYAPSAISALAIMGTGWVAYKNSKWSYVNQNQIEIDKRDAEANKNLKDNYKRIYSEISSLMFEFLNKSILSDYEKLYHQYYNDLMVLYNHFHVTTEKELSDLRVMNLGNQNGIEFKGKEAAFIKQSLKYKELFGEFKDKAEKAYTNMIDHTNLMTDCFNRINKVAYEYEYLKSDSQAVTLINQFTDHLNGFIGDDYFKDLTNKAVESNKMDITPFMNLRDRIVKANVQEHEKSVKPFITQIQEQLKLETKI